MLSHRGSSTYPPAFMNLLLAILYNSFTLFLCENVSLLPFVQANQPQCETLSSGNKIIIECSHVNELGNEVSHIMDEFQELLNINTQLELKVIHAKFKNRTISKHWYIGNDTISELTFRDCNIEIIDADAFRVDAFRLLSYLKIVNNNGIISFYPNCFKGLSRIMTCEFLNCSIDQANVGHLSDISKNLKSFYMKHCSNHIGFRNIFGGHQFANLNLVLFTNCSGHQFKTFAPSNFTNLLVLQTLHIFNTSLEVILDGTFDGIAKTLERIMLIDNRLLAIVPRVFQAYLENSYSIYSSVTIVNFNQLECNCEYAFFRSICEIVYKTPAPDAFNSCERPPSANADQKFCQNIQQIRSEKLCWSHQWQNLLSYIRFDIKRDDEGILIRTNATGPIKVVLMRSGMELDHHCPDVRALQPDIKCYIFNKNVLRLPQSELIESHLIQISILYFFHGWPLCIMTVRYSHDTNENTNWGLITGAIIMCYVLAIFLGLLIIFVIFTVFHCCNTNGADTIDYEPQSTRCPSEANSYEISGLASPQFNFSLYATKSVDSWSYEYIDQ